MALDRLQALLKQLDLILEIRRALDDELRGCRLTELEIALGEPHRQALRADGIGIPVCHVEDLGVRWLVDPQIGEEIPGIATAINRDPLDGQNIAIFNQYAASSNQWRQFISVVTDT